MARKAKDEPIAEAPKVRIPESLLSELDREAELYAPGTKMSRIQIVSIALREWVDARKAQREAKTKQ